MSISRSPRLLLLLAFLSLLFLTCFIFIDAIFPFRVEGNLTYTRITGEPVNRIIIYVPILEGKNIFKVYEMKAISPRGAWVVTPGPKGADEYPDYWVLEGSSLGSGETLQVQFTMKYDKGVDYEEFLWRVVADTEIEVPVTVYRNFLLDMIALLASYKTIIILSLGILSIISASAALVFAKKTESPVAFYKPREKAEPVYQQIPEEKSKRCKDMHHICLRFFIVDECFGSRERLGNKSGLLKNVKYFKNGLGALSPESKEKILELIEDANKIWAKCCVKLVPCLDEENEPIFKALDIGVFKPSITLTVREPYLKVNEHPPIKAKVTYTLNPCSLLEGRDLKGCDGFKKSRVKVKIVWNDKRVEDPGYRVGEEVGVEQYREWISDTIEYYKRQLTDDKIRRKLEEEIKRRGINPDEKLSLFKEIVESYQKILDIGLKNKKDGLSMEVLVDLFQVFNEMVDETYKKHCINVFVFKGYSDSWYKGEEKGFAEIFGRGIFLDELVVEKCRGDVLAHEVGHNLGLFHHKNEDNVMHVPSGRNLDEEQCAKIIKHLKSGGGKTKYAHSREIETYLKRKRKETEKAEKEKRKPKPTVSKPKKVKPPPAKPIRKKAEEVEKIKKEIENLKKDIERKEYLIKRNHIRRMREILKEEYDIDEESLEGDDIEKWPWPKEYKEHEVLLRLRNRYNDYKKEIENLRKQIESLNRKLNRLKTK